MLYITNKIERFRFKSGCAVTAVWVVKGLKEDWLIVLRYLKQLCTAVKTCYC